MSERIATAKMRKAYELTKIYSRECKSRVGRHGIKRKDDRITAICRREIEDNLN
jgi:hypothetical protein